MEEWQSEDNRPIDTSDWKIKLAQLEFKKSKF